MTEQEIDENFEPKIVAFACNYCAYAAADLAGTSRLIYAPNVRIIRIPCSGKIDITYLFRALEKGADAVFVAGCLKEQCHFIDGNYRAEERVLFAKEILDAIGFPGGGERIEMFFLSAAMAPTFVEIANEMTERAKRLGPNPFQDFKEEFFEGEAEEFTKREFLFSMIERLASKIPEKPIPIPEPLDEFGTLQYDVNRCVTCLKCEKICPEEVFEFSKELDLKGILEKLPTASIEKKQKKHLLYETISKIAKKIPTKPIPVPEELFEYGNMLKNLRRCVACNKCVDQCLEDALCLLRDLDLKSILTSTVDTTQ